MIKLRVYPTKETVRLLLKDRCVLVAVRLESEKNKLGKLSEDDDEYMHIQASVSYYQMMLAELHDQMSLVGDHAPAEIAVEIELER